MPAEATPRHNPYICTPLPLDDMALRLLWLLWAVQAAASAFDNTYAVRFESQSSVRVRDHNRIACDLTGLDESNPTANLHVHDILVISAADTLRACEVNVSDPARTYRLDNNSDFARLVVEGLPKNVTGPFSISLDCRNTSSPISVQVAIASDPAPEPKSCCAGDAPANHAWCHRCGKGQYRDGLQCQSCPDGKSTPETGVYTLQQCACPAGYGDEDGRCQKCALGKFRNASSSSSKCTECPDNSTVAMTEKGATSCLPSLPNATAAAAQPYRPSQYLRPRQRECGKECCVPGEYWNAAERTCANCVDGYNYTAERGATECQPCPDPEPGYEVVGCFAGEGTSRQCPQGYYRERNDASPFCTACPPGTTTRTGEKTSASDCLCAPGYYRDSENTGACLACEEGTYQAGINTESCESCRLHKTTKSKASTSIEDCVCDRGFAGAPGDAVCERCERGSYADELDSVTCTRCTQCEYGGVPSGCGGASPGQRCATCQDENCPLFALGQRCDDCGQCEFNKTYSLDLNLMSWFNSQQDVCGECSGKFTQDQGYDTCAKCPAGKTGANGYRICDEGEDATPEADIGSSAQCRVCQNCEVGTFKDSEGEQTCQRCQIGTYADVAGRTACVLCGANKTTDVLGADDEAYCHCDSGFYHNDTNATDNHQCFRCEPGFYSDATNQRVCSVCEAGTHNNHSAHFGDSSYCEQCPDNTFAPKGSADCIACVHAKSKAGSTNVSDCFCNAGYYKMADSETCTACAAGTYKSAVGDFACTSCDAGTFAAGAAATACTTCLENTYAAVGATSCTPCANAKAPPGSTNQTDCVCTPGYRTEGLNTGVCVACAPGSYAHLLNMSACLACVPGTFAAGAAATACTTCLENTYAAANAAACTACPNSTAPSGSTSRDNCTCNAGYIANTSSASEADYCQACPAGTFHAAADCTACPSGKFSTAVAATSVGQCTDCATGKFSLAGSAVCFECPDGMTALNATHCRGIQWRISSGTCRETCAASGMTCNTQEPLTLSDADAVQKAVLASKGPLTDADRVYCTCSPGPDSFFPACKDVACENDYCEADPASPNPFDGFFGFATYGFGVCFRNRAPATVTGFDCDKESGLSWGFVCACDAVQNMHDKA